MTPQQIRDMIDMRRESDIISDEGQALVGNVTPTIAREKLKDLQLAAALEAMTGKLKADKWPKVGESGADELVVQQRIANLLRQRDLLSDRLGEIDDELNKLREAEAPAEDETEPADRSS